jgi:hypothetical protein
MELRRTPRVPNDRTVKLVILGDSEISASASVRDASGNGLGLLSSIAVPAGAAVQIEFEDTIFLGEAMYCQAAEGGYLVGVELKQVLSGLAALARAAATFSAQLEMDVTPLVRTS